MAILLVVGGFALFYGIGSLVENSDFLKTGVLIIAGIWIFGLFIIYICSPIFLIIRGMIDNKKSKSLIKTIIAIILTAVIIAGVVYTCGSYNKYSDERYEPHIKMRPDRF